MPNTPFVGLSVLFHLLIIWIGRMLDRFPWLSRRASAFKKMIGTPHWLVGCAIIIFVFGFGLLTASTLLALSLSDSHSSVRYAEYHLPVIISVIGSFLGLISSSLAMIVR